MDFSNGEGLSINSNYNFWKYTEVLELNKDLNPKKRRSDAHSGERRHLQAQAHLRLHTVEKLHKRPSVFINHLRAFSSAKGMAFATQQQPEEGAAPQRKKTKKE